MAGGTVAGLRCLRLFLAGTAPSPRRAGSRDPDSSDREERFRSTTKARMLGPGLALSKSSSESHASKGVGGLPSTRALPRNGWRPSPDRVRAWASASRWTPGRMMRQLVRGAVTAWSRSTAWRAAPGGRVGSACRRRWIQQAAVAAAAAPREPGPTGSGRARRTVPTARGTRRCSRGPGRGAGRAPAVGGSCAGAAPVVPGASGRVSGGPSPCTAGGGGEPDRVGHRGFGHRRLAPSRELHRMHPRSGPRLRRPARSGWLHRVAAAHDDDSDEDQHRHLPARARRPP